MDETKYWLWLSLVFGNSLRDMWQIMCAFETASEAYYELCDGCRFLELTKKENNNIKSVSLHHAEEIIEKCKKKGIGIIGYNSEKYPLKIKYLCDPPAVLYYKGNIDCLCGAKTITTVGTRNASDYALYAAERICSELAHNGIVIVSGFAVGIDIRTHLAAVANNMPTVCVLGSGIDINYPSDNFKYRDKIIETGGVFISEFPIGMNAFGSNFPRRNRVLSALGQAVVVFQASVDSGALITADWAAQQGREVFCLPPPNIFSYEYSGNTELLRSGAIPLCSSNDIMAYLDWGAATIPDAWAEEAEKRRKKYITHKKRNKENNIEEDIEILKEELKFREDVPPEEYDIEEIMQKILKVSGASEVREIQRKIVVFLAENGASHADVIAEVIDVDATDLTIELTELELINIINSLPGKIFELKKVKE